MQNPQYGDTHCIKADLPKERRETMTEEEIRNTPFLGGMHAIERKQQTMPVYGTSGNDSFDEDLPF